MSLYPEKMDIPEGLSVANESAFLEKLNNFARLGAAGLHCVLDFDRTLTVKRPGSHDEVTTWHIMNEHLPSDAQEQYQQYFARYRALELAADMTTLDAVEWWSAILDLFVANKVSLFTVENTFLDKASIRAGAKELFDLFGDMGVPTTVLSAGIRDVIDIWSAEYAIKPSLILSTKLQVDFKGVVIGWDRSTLVHALNKHETGHPGLTAIQSARPNTLVIGDSLDDASMADGDDNVMRIRILDRRDDDPDLVTERARTFERFDALVTSGSMSPITALVRDMCDPPTKLLITHER